MSGVFSVLLRWECDSKVSRPWNVLASNFHISDFIKPDSKWYGPPVLKKDKALLYRTDNPAGRSTSNIEWVVAIETGGKFEVVGTYKTRKEALKWLELVS